MNSRTIETTLFCKTTLDLNKPIRIEKVRGFQPPWRKVFVLKCETCGTEHKVKADPNGEVAIDALQCGTEIRMEPCCGNVK